MGVALVARVVALAIWLALPFYYEPFEPTNALSAVKWSTGFLLGVAVARWWALGAPLVGAGVLMLVLLVIGESFGELGVVGVIGILIAYALVLSIPLGLGVALGRWLFG